jgi:hypothetical protein
MFNDEFHYMPTGVNEIEASLSYLNEKSAAIGKLLDAMHRFASDIDRWGIEHTKFYTLHTHLCEELLLVETDRAICEQDLKKEVIRASETIYQ